MLTWKRLVLIALCLLPLAGCGSSTQPSDEPDTELRAKALGDPMGYKPDLEKNVDDTSGMNKDLHDVFGP